ncbi:MAG TPA: hypothetical protein VKB55_18600, partial [Nocardioidaceae bacterium]|nr:hypothetical protein [Nocardioidaceae bacterium]
LPPVANLAKVWIATPPKQAKSNRSATTCDQAQFNGNSVSGVQTRFYVVPEAKQLPPTFGISETVAQFKSEKSAKAYQRRLEKRLKSCEDRVLTAHVRDPSRLRAPGVNASAWSLSLEARHNKAVEYRLALVRNGSRLAEILFTPVGRFDVTKGAFNALALRAGQRLAELG